VGQVAAEEGSHWCLRSSEREGGACRGGVACAVGRGRGCSRVAVGARRCLRSTGGGGLRTKREGRGEDCEVGCERSW